MKERQHVAPHVVVRGAAAPFEHVALEHRVHRGVRMHHTLLPAGGAAGVHDERELVTVDGHVGQRGGALRDGLRHGGHAGRRRVAVEHAQQRRDARRVQQLAQLGARVQRGVDHEVPRLGVFEDVADGIDRERRVDRHPHEAGLLDADQRDHHLDRVVAQHGHALAAGQAQAQQVVREAVRCGVELAVAHAVLAFDERGARAEAPRAAVDHVAQRDAGDALEGGGRGLGTGGGHGGVSPVVGGVRSERRLRPAPPAGLAKSGYAAPAARRGRVRSGP
ncbi:hypothetical protein FQZ97_744090 [compost metagenome]